MASNLQPFGPDPSDAFKRTYVDILPAQHPEVVQRIKGHHVNREDSTLLNRLIQQSPEMRLSVCLYLAKYAPAGSQPKIYADGQLANLIDYWFTKKVPDREFLADGLLSFMVDNPKVFKHYADLLRSWEMTETNLVRIMSKGGGDSSGGGNSSGNGPEGDIPGFDPG